MPNTITGSVSHGTMRTCDLIPAFLDTLRVIAPAAYSQCMGIVPAYVQDGGDSSEWWDSEDAQGHLEALFDTLNEYAPEGYYFGAHPGDGSDYGFWAIED